MGTSYDGTAMFIANLKEKVQWLSEWDMEEMGNFYFSRVRYFEGTESDRELALERAQQMLDEPYRFLSFNCESFSNWVQKGKAYSQQVALGGATVAGAGLLIAGKSENKWVQALGIGMAIFGGYHALKEL